MIRINLLPVKKSRRQEIVQRELLIAGIGLGLLVLLLASLFLYRSAEINNARAGNEDLKRKIEEMKAIVAQVDEAEKFKADLQKKLTVIKELKANKAGPVRMLDELAQAVPDKLQLTALDEEGGLIKLTGTAVSNEVISQFLSSLEQSEYFGDVFLNAIDQTVKDGVKLKSFSVTMQLIIPGMGGESKDGADPPAPGQPG